MSVLAWNCRGLGNSNTLNYLSGLVKKYKPSCVFLSETKGGMGVDWVARKLGFEKWKRVEANGRSGGIIWLWKEEIDLEVE